MTGKRGGFSDYAMMEHHLRGNHFPPLPYSLIPVALRAVKLSKQGKAYSAKVHMPDDCGHRQMDARRNVPVHIIMHDLHMDHLIPQDNEEVIDE